MKVWVALVETADQDYYVFAFEYEPTVSEVLTLVKEHENTNDLAWYIDTADVMITKRNVRQRIQKPPETPTSV
jgi:hypothetical protein